MDHVIEGAEYDQGPIVWIDGRGYDLATAWQLVDSGWTRIDDGGRYYVRRTSTKIPDREGDRVEGLTDDPQLLAIARMSTLVDMYGAAPIDQRFRGRLPVPSPTEAVLFNQQWTKTEQSPKNRRLAEIWGLDRPLPSSTLLQDHGFA